MSEIKFTDLLKLPDEKFRNLKLVFNSNWEYKPNEKPEYVQKKIGTNPEIFEDMLSSYRSHTKEITESTKLHNPKNRRFLKNEYIMCFIPYGGKDWLLVNAFKVVDDNKELIDVDESAMGEVSQFIGKLVITWERTTRNIRMKDPEKIQKLTVKTVLDVPYSEKPEKFPGYKNIAITHTELKEKISEPEWEHYLKARKGIYLVADRATGKLYIGSAYGKDGIYGRWKTYAKSGYDRHERENGKYPNKKLQQLVKDKTIKYIEQNFQYTLLETFTDDVSSNEIIEREEWWKKRFLSREFGYNKN